MRLEREKGGRREEERERGEREKVYRLEREKTEIPLFTGIIIIRKSKRIYK